MNLNCDKIYCDKIPGWHTTFDESGRVFSVNTCKKDCSVSHYIIVIEVWPVLSL